MLKNNFKNSSCHLLLLLIVAWASACSETHSYKEPDNFKKLPSEMNIKRSLIEKDFKYSSTGLSENKVLPFSVAGYPQGLAVKNGNIFVVDNNKGEVFKFDITSKNEIQKTPINLEQDLSYPNDIQILKDKTLISDNEGIKFFDNKGKFQKLLRIFRPINNYFADANGFIYANSSTSKVDTDKSLILKIDEKGQIISRFGKTTRNSRFNQDNSSAFISVSDKFIVLAYINTPKIQIYDKNKETLLKEIKIYHPIFNDLKKRVAKEKINYEKQGKVFLPRYIAGLKVFQDKIYLLLHLPYLEIIELDFNGIELSRLQFKEGQIINDYFGFDIALVDEKSNFIVGTLENSRNPMLMLLSSTNQENTGGKIENEKE